MQDFFVYILHGHKKRSRFGDSFCDPCRIQTCNPHIRSVVLYSVELMDRKEGAVRTRLELARNPRPAINFLPDYQSVG